MSALERIVAHKKAQLAEQKKHTSLADMQDMAFARPSHDFRPFATSLLQPGIHVIAEIKRASPSKGDIAPDLDPATLALEYEYGGACALSVLTEDSGFKGSPADLKAARAAVHIPVLRKDFIFEEYQIYESVALGADALLLIVRLLEQSTLVRFVDICLKMGIEPLVEIHDDSEVERVRHLPCRLIGINNRNLGSFTMDMQRATTLGHQLGAHQVPISLSGILEPADAQPMITAGITRFLIGEALSKSSQPQDFIKKLGAV